MLVKYDNPPKIWIDQFIQIHRGVPSDLYYIFMPATEVDFIQYKKNLLTYLKRAICRDEVMKLQRKYSMPLRPNQSVRELLIKIRLQQLKQKVKGWKQEDSSDD